MVADVNRLALTTHRVRDKPRSYCSIRVLTRLEAPPEQFTPALLIPTTTIISYRQCHRLDMRWKNKRSSPWPRCLVALPGHFLGVFATLA